MLQFVLDNNDSLVEKSKFEDLYYEYISLFMYLALKKLNNQHDAEDAVQNALMYIARNFDKIHIMEKPAQKKYLVTIVNGFSIDLYRKKSKEYQRFDDSLEIVDIEYPFDEFEAVELSDAILKLDAEQKNFIYLTYVYGYKSHEIAKMFDVKDTYVRKKLQIARNELHKILVGGGKDE